MEELRGAEGSWKINPHSFFLHTSISLLSSCPFSIFLTFYCNCSRYAPHARVVVVVYKQPTYLSISTQRTIKTPTDHHQKNPNAIPTHRSQPSKTQPKNQPITPSPSSRGGTSSAGTLSTERALAESRVPSPTGSLRNDLRSRFVACLLD